jgi:hypothetical protein
VAEEESPSGAVFQAPLWLKGGEPTVPCTMVTYHITNLDSPHTTTLSSPSSLTTTTNSSADITSLTNQLTHLTMTDKPPSGLACIAADPQNFDGTRTQFATWFRQMQLFLRANPDQIDTDEKKIIATVSHMRGGVAGPWANTYFDKANKAGNFEKWSDFQDQLKTMFEDHAAKRTACDKIQTLNRVARRLTSSLQNLRF